MFYEKAIIYLGTVGLTAIGAFVAVSCSNEK
ncbi:Vmc-like lipoprotein signal peptide domain-containing protein [Mesoplasma entomophilum]